MEKIEEEIKDMTPKLIGEVYRKQGKIYPVKFGIYLCQYCGEEFECRTKDICTPQHSKGTKSCGCLIGRKIIHGLHSHKAYAVHKAIKQRCYNPKNKKYMDYGGRGIIVCEEWLDVVKFIDWHNKTYIEGYSLDRIDNNKDYSPENCRWADASTQAVNQRKMKNNTSGFVGITWNKNNKNWRGTIQLNKYKVNLGSFKILEEAVQARDNYIIENNLPHKLSTQY